MKAFPMKINVRVHSEDVKNNSLNRFNIVFIIVIFFFIVIPIFLLILAKDSLPTSSFYPVKRFYEKAVSTAFSYDPFLKSEVSLLLLAARYKETDKLLLDFNSIDGLESLVSQAYDTKNVLLALPMGSGKYQIITRFLETLVKYESGLEGRKLELIARHEGRLEPVISLVAAIDKEKEKLSEIQRDAEEKRNQKN